MATTVSPEEARRLVLEPSDVELWTIAHALDHSGQEFYEGVSVRLVADMLQVGEPENWERTTRRAERPDELFSPQWRSQRDDGNAYRSWLPEDLDDGDDTRIRPFAELVKNDFVKARFFEILWSRYRKFPDANAAIIARIASAKQCDAERNWPRLVKNLGRLSTLVLSVNAKDKFHALVELLDDAAQALARCSRPFSFPALADMVCSTLLAKKGGKEAFTEARGTYWAGLLSDVARGLEQDPHHGHDALMVLQAWHRRWGDEQAMNAVQRAVVEQLRTAAEKSSPERAPALYQRALQAALDFGIGDLSEVVRLELMTSIQSSLPTFKQISGTFTVPPEILAEIDRIIGAGSHLPGSIRVLSLLPGLLEVDTARLRATVKEQLADHPLLVFAQGVHYHLDGRVSFRSNDPEGSIERHVGFSIGSHLALVEAILRYVLAQALPRMEPRTLVEAMADWPHLPPHRLELVGVAAERFAAGDWIASAFVIVPLYEAVLRDLLRAGGYPALKVEAGGAQMDETLNSLIRSNAARSVLGDGHCDLVEYVLADAALGWNLRNEIAHGTIRAESLTPMRVFLTWLLVIRLTCFVAQPPAPDASSDEMPS